jgi:hypothetical protein
MTSATLAILVLAAVGAIAGFVVFVLLPGRTARHSEKPINDSDVAQRWAGAHGHAAILDHSASTPSDLSGHGGVDGGSAS